VRPAVAEWEQRVFAHLAADGEQIAGLFAADGVEGVMGWQRTPGRGRRGPARPYVFTGDLEEASGQEVSAEGLGLVRKAQASGQTETLRSGFVFMLARPLPSAGGEDATLLLVVRGRGGHGPGGRPPRAIEILGPEVLLPRLVAVVVIVGAFCYWMSRYLTSPLRRLRAAARSLAGGDLGVRVDPVVGSRRDEIGDLARDFDVMAERVQNLVESQKQLLRDVSHELRSPLARLEVGLELARQDRGDAQDEHLDRIQLESTRLNQLIGRLMILTRMEGDGGAHADQVVNLGRLVQEVVDDAVFEARTRGCDVVAEVDEFELSGTADLLRSAVENVVRNALRYTAPGTEVEVKLVADGETCALRVRDHGPGVPEEQLEQIFEPFARVGDDRDREAGGVGLGLAITERAVRLHGGSVEAANADGGGLEVAMRFARRGAAAD
jgi:two-component system sensor histidine kinase CpxA